MRKILSITLVIILMLGLVACGNSEKPANPNQSATEPGEPTETVPEETLPVETETSDKNSLSAAILDMAYADTQKNTMFSPLSLDMAIALVAEGADNKECFDEFLGRDDYAQYAANYFARMEYLNQESTYSYANYKTIFEIANALYVDSEYKLQDKYLEMAAKYNAEAKDLNFADKPLAVSAINKWASDKTHEMIQELIQESNLSDDTKMVALNAVYFESPEEPWLVDTDYSDFQQFDGSELSLNMIRTTNKLYYENDKATAFGSYYANGLVFIGILPKAKGEFNMQDLNLDSLLASENTDYIVNSAMPKFKFENEIENLTSYLSTLGYGEMFAEDALPNIVMTGDKNVALRISNIIQADAIELDENGTKAAAATAIILDANGAIMTPPEEKDVILDRPFAFLIYDPQMHQIVFMGKVVVPRC